MNRLMLAVPGRADLHLVPKPPQRTLGDLLHELARRPGGQLHITMLTRVVLHLLSVLPPEP